MEQVAVRKVGESGTTLIFKVLRMISSAMLRLMTWEESGWFLSQIVLRLRVGRRNYVGNIFEKGKRAMAPPLQENQKRLILPNTQHNMCGVGQFISMLLYGVHLFVKMNKRYGVFIISCINRDETINYS